MTPTVTWLTADVDAGAADLWVDLGARGMLPRGRIVVHVARDPRVPLVVATARSLVAHLRAQEPDRPIVVLDSDALADEWAPTPLLDLARMPRYRVDGPCLADGTPVPALWLEPFSLVTVAGAAPDSRYRVSAVLAAQARPLQPCTGLDLDVLYEAHRLMGSDLAIVCGSVVFARASTPRWWAASDDDAVLEQAVAAAAGASGPALPALRHFARHETLTGTWRDVGHARPRLAGHLAPRARTAVRRSGLWLAHAARATGTDLSRSATNLRRLPDFVRRHWLARLRPGAAGS